MLCHLVRQPADFLYVGAQQRCEALQALFAAPAQSTRALQHTRLARPEWKKATQPGEFDFSEQLLL